MKRWLVILKPLALATVLFFVGRAIWRDLRGVEDWSRFHPSLPWVLASIGFLACINLVQLISYRALLLAYGHRLTAGQMIPVAWIPPLGKYVPGKIFALLGAMAMLRRLGVTGAVAIGVVLMMDALAVLSGLVVGSPILARHSTPGLIIAGVCVVGGIVVLHPAIFVRLLNRVLAMMKKQPLDRPPTLRQFVVPVACAFSQWIFAGLAMGCMTRSLSPIGLDALPSLVAVQACAMTLGYLALIAPGGLGVTDGIRLVVLKSLVPQVDPATIAVVVVGLRIAQTAVEVLLAGAAAIVLRTQRTI